MLFAGIGTHGYVFQTMLLDPESGELAENRFEPSHERLGDWATHGHLFVRRAGSGPHQELESGFRPFCEVLVSALTSRHTAPPAHGLLTILANTIRNPAGRLSVGK